jgi:hypothetical protein
MKKKTPLIATEAIHLTLLDETKSLSKLISEQSVGSPLPEKPIAKLHFLVDPFNDALLFPTVKGFQPEGFQWGILPGQDKKFKTTKVKLNAIDALDFFLVKTTGVCNFLVVMEFYE